MGYVRNSLYDKVRILKGIVKLKNILDKREKSRLVSNFLSLFTLQALNYVLPLVTLPYLVKTLGVEKFGLISFATAIMTYFTVLTDYGFNFTATREISLNKDNPKVWNEVFSNVIIIKSILLCVSFGILLLLIFNFIKFAVDSDIYLYSFFAVIGQALFPVWFFQGIEKMKYITYINIFSKVFFTISVFIFVKQSSDAYLVPLLTGIGSIVASLWSLFIIFKDFKIKFESQSYSRVLWYLRGGWSLFLTTGFSNILTSSGMVLLSNFGNNSLVGYYSALEKLSRAFVGLFSPLTQALYPLSCNKVSHVDSGRKYISKLLIGIGGLAFVVSLVVVLFSKEIVILIYNEKFVSYSYILSFLMIWLFFGVINNIFGIQYLSAKKLDKYYMRAFIFAGLLTLILNVSLIPILMINGLLIGIIVGEITLTLLMMFFIYRFKL